MTSSKRTRRTKRTRTRTVGWLPRFRRFASPPARAPGRRGRRAPGRGAGALLGDGGGGGVRRGGRRRVGGRRGGGRDRDGRAGRAGGVAGRTTRRAALAVAIAAVCGGPAMVLAPMAGPHAETRALAIRLLAALLPRSRAPTEARPGAAGAPGGGGGAGGGADAPASRPPRPPGSRWLTAAPGAFVHSISSAMSSNFGERAAGERAANGGARRRRRRRLGSCTPPRLVPRGRRGASAVPADARRARGAL